jgi:hypothetical protein
MGSVLRFYGRALLYVAPLAIAAALGFGGWAVYKNITAPKCEPWEFVCEKH